MPVEDLAASFQDAVTRVLVKKTLLAQKEFDVPRLVLAGERGVAANSDLRRKLSEQSSVQVYFRVWSFVLIMQLWSGAAAHFCGAQANLDARVYSRNNF